MPSTPITCDICSQPHKDPRNASRPTPEKATPCKFCGAMELHWGLNTGARLGDSMVLLFHRDGTPHKHNSKGDLLSGYLPNQAKPATPAPQAPTTAPQQRWPGAWWAPTVDLTPIITRIQDLETRQGDLATLITKVADTTVDHLDKFKKALEVFGQEVETIRNQVNAARPIQIHVPNKPPTILGKQHKQFETALTMLAQHINVMLVGPTGSTKTSAVEPMAQALGVPAYIIPPPSSESRITGYMDAYGKYVTTMVREAFEHGGLLCFDEYDATHPVIGVAANALLANDNVGFADGMVKRHPDCYFMATANTYGRGGDLEYVGRQQQDAAALNRWRKLYWDYDWDLIRSLAGNDTWVDLVQKLSEEILRLGKRINLGTRVAVDGAKLLAAGMPWDQVMEICVWAEMSAADRAQLEALL